MDQDAGLAETLITQFQAHIERELENGGIILCNI